MASMSVGAVTSRTGTFVDLTRRQYITDFSAKRRDTGHPSIPGSAASKDSESLMRLPAPWNPPTPAPSWYHSRRMPLFW